MARRHTSSPSDFAAAKGCGKVISVNKSWEEMRACCIEHQATFVFLQNVRRYVLDRIKDAILVTDRALARKTAPILRLTDVSDCCVTMISAQNSKMLSHSYEECPAVQDDVGRAELKNYKHQTNVVATIPCATGGRSTVGKHDVFRFSCAV